MSLPSFINIAAYIPARAHEQPQTLSIVEPRGGFSRQHTFRELDLVTDALLSHLSYEERELLHPLAQAGFQ